MTPIDRLIAADRQTPKRILVCGDCMTDVYVHGHMAVAAEGAA